MCDVTIGILLKIFPIICLKWKTQLYQIMQFYHTKLKNYVSHDTITINKNKWINNRQNRPFPIFYNLWKKQMNITVSK